jgi:dimethylamine corrinoid protein
MVSKNKILQSIEETILVPAPGKIRKVLLEATEKEMSPDAVLKALTRGMERVRHSFQDKTSTLPDLLLSVDAFRDGLRQMKPLPVKGNTSRQDPSIVIGVVEGDVHDLGRDVPRDRFLDAVRDRRADVLALSSMMSTPLDSMREVIRWARKLHPGIRILVGGAALDETLAAKLGADGYAENAGGAAGEIRRVLQRPPAAKQASRG